MDVQMSVVFLSCHVLLFVLIGERNWHGSLSCHLI
jgi:hypothetical protein